MNFDEIYQLAETECKHLKDTGRIKITISSLMDDVNASNVFDRFKAEIGGKNVNASIIQAGSSGYYDLEPFVMIEMPDQSVRFHKNVTPEKATDIVDNDLIKGNPGKETTFSDGSDLPLFNLQNRIVLRNCGHINPENIHHYIYLGNGYSGLSKALMMSREKVIEEVKKSGLRGRGGAGFDTADKWQSCSDAEGDEKFVVCNAVDADPRSKSARLLLESDPHSVIEGLLIGAYAVGASKGVICVNREYPFSVQKLNKAFDQMKEYGLIGKNILNSPFHCDLDIVQVEASLVSGEETALICSMEGKPAMSYVRPPFPAVKGFKNKPTLVNNLETLSNVSAIFQHGQEFVSGSGTDGSKGTKVMGLSGHVSHQYTIEVAFGTTLLSTIEKIGGGVPGGKKLKAVQLGGPTGAYFAADSLDIPIDYESVEEAGSIIGSGTIELLSDDSCAVETCRDILSYIHNQSCGKCVFCREGTHQMSDILAGISEQAGRPQDLDLLTELSEAMKIGCICGLGRSAPNPVLSSIRLFRDEYDYHIKEKKCPLNGDH